MSMYRSEQVKLDCRTDGENVIQKVLAVSHIYKRPVVLYLSLR